MKECISCHDSKELEAFPKHSGMQDGHINVCKRCRHDYCKAWRKKNRDSIKLKKAEYYKTFKQQLREKYKVDKKKNPDKYKAHNLMHSFGISLDEYNELIEKQNNLCAICKNPETAVHNGNLRSLAVDHCHKTHKIRGLLCSKCNLGIGLLNENKEILLSAIEYLKNSPN